MSTYDLYKNRCRHLFDFIAYDKKYDALNCYLYFNDILSMKDYQKCKNIDSTRAHKRARCFHKYFSIEILAKLTSASMVFGTITFNNDFLLANYDTQKKRIQRYLKKHFFYVIKNKDFGTKTERLHYHFIGLTFDTLTPNGVRSKKGRPMYNLKNDTWSWGFAPNLEIIEYNCKDKKRITNYMVKLNNHSNKISVRKSRLSILKNKKYLQKYCTFGDIVL